MALHPGGPATPGPAGEPAGTAVAVAEPSPEPAGGPAAPGKEERSRRDAAATMGRAAHDTAGRVAASVGALDGRQPRFEAASAVSGGGVLAALPSLLRAGLLRRAALLELPKGFYGLPSLLLWAFLLLARVRNPERLGYRDPGEWGALPGLDRCPCPRTLRRRTRQLAECEGLPAWIGSLARDWCDDPDTVATLFVDGHVQTYGGQGNLPKHFVPHLKLALPAAAAYWVHALGGAPLLCLHRQVDDGMVREIRMRIVPQLQELGLRPDAPDPEAEPVLTLVFDREGWSPQLFHELRAKGVAVVTWIKGPQEGQVAERKLELEFGPAKARTVLEAREIRFRADRRLRGRGKNDKPRKPLQLFGQPGKGQRQPSVLTTHPSLPAEQVAGLLRSRWSQENCFKYMRSEFGLDTLPEHALEEVEPDAWGVSPAWRTIEKALKKERNAVGHLRRRRAAETDIAKAGELDARIRACDQAIAGLVRARKSTDQHVRAGELTAEQRLQALPEPLRALTDTLRMITCRSETAMAAAVAPALGHPDTVRSLLEALFQTGASLLPDPAAGTLTVRLLHQATRAREAALAPLLDELNQTRTVFPGTSLRLVYEILPAGPSPPPSSPPRPPPLSADVLCNLNETV